MDNQNVEKMFDITPFPKDKYKEGIRNIRHRCHDVLTRYSDLILPTIFDESLSYYEKICYLAKMLKEVLEMMSKLMDDIQNFIDEMTDNFNTLKEWTEEQIAQIKQEWKEFEEKINQAIADLTKRVEDCETLVAQLQEELHEFEEETGKKFEDVQNQINTINNTIEQIKNDITTINNHLTVIDGQIVQINADIAKEIADRIAGDDALRASLDQEVQDRIAGDQTNLDKINQEIQDRKGADQNLQDQITSNDQDIANLQAGLNKEKEDRTNADNDLQKALNQEIDNRVTDFGNLQAAIATEKTERKEADAANKTQIDINVTDITNLKTLTSSLSTDIGNLTDLISGLQGDVQTINNKITSLTSQVTNLNNYINGNQFKVDVKKIVNDGIADGTIAIPDSGVWHYPEWFTDEIYYSPFGGMHHTGYNKDQRFTSNSPTLMFSCIGSKTTYQPTLQTAVMVTFWLGSSSGSTSDVVMYVKNFYNQSEAPWSIDYPEYDILTTPKDICMGVYDNSPVIVYLYGNSVKIQFIDGSAKATISLPNPTSTSYNAIAYNYEYKLWYITSEKRLFIFDSNFTEQTHPEPSGYAGELENPMICSYNNYTIVISRKTNKPTLYCYSYNPNKMESMYLEKTLQMPRSLTTENNVHYSSFTMMVGVMYGVIACDRIAQVVKYCINSLDKPQKWLVANNQSSSPNISMYIRCDEDQDPSLGLSDSDFVQYKIFDSELIGYLLPYENCSIQMNTNIFRTNYVVIYFPYRLTIMPISSSKNTLAALQLNIPFSDIHNMYLRSTVYLQLSPYGPIINGQGSIILYNNNILTNSSYNSYAVDTYGSLFIFNNTIQSGSTTSTGNFYRGSKVGEFN